MPEIRPLLTTEDEARLLRKLLHQVEDMLASNAIRGKKPKRWWTVRQGGSGGAATNIATQFAIVKTAAGPATETAGGITGEPGVCELLVNGTNPGELETQSGDIDFFNVDPTASMAVGNLIVLSSDGDIAPGSESVIFAQHATTKQAIVTYTEQGSTAVKALAKDGSDVYWDGEACT